MNYGKIFVILGKAGAGKSSIAREVSKDLNIPHVITYTTRPPREGEINGLDYHFVHISEFEFTDFVCEEQYMVKPYGYQRYGVKQSDLETMNDIVIVLTPSGYYELKEKYGDRVVGIYIMASFWDRYNRYIQRDPKDPKVIEEAKRRFTADEEDFYELEYKAEHIVINNKSFKFAVEDTKTLVVLEGF